MPLFRLEGGRATDVGKLGRREGTEDATPSGGKDGWPFTIGCGRDGREAGSTTLAEPCAPPPPSIGRVERGCGGGTETSGGGTTPGAGGGAAIAGAGAGVGTTSASESSSSESLRSMDSIMLGILKFTNWIG